MSDVINIPVTADMLNFIPTDSSCLWENLNDMSYIDPNHDASVLHLYWLWRLLGELFPEQEQLDKIEEVWRTVIGTHQLRVIGTHSKDLFYRVMEHVEQTDDVVLGLAVNRAMAKVNSDDSILTRDIYLGSQNMICAKYMYTFYSVETPFVPPSTNILRFKMTQLLCAIGSLNANVMYFIISQLNTIKLDYDRVIELKAIIDIILTRYPECIALLTLTMIIGEHCNMNLSKIKNDKRESLGLRLL